MIRSSAFWKDHFENNLTKRRINWDQVPSITEEQKERIIPSLKAWQLGETSEGKDLIQATKKFVHRTGDNTMLEAVKLFIKEEQKHGANLGRYIDLIGEERKQRDVGDSLFRFVRHLNKSMEAWTITVYIVESAAEIYYKAIHDATDCILLRQICCDILIDERHHLEFQIERLNVLYANHNSVRRRFSWLTYHALFSGIMRAVWIAHGRAFKAGGVSRKSYNRMMRNRFYKMLSLVYRAETKPEMICIVPNRQL